MHVPDREPQLLLLCVRWDLCDGTGEGRRERSKIADEMGLLDGKNFRCSSSFRLCHRRSAAVSFSPLLVETFLCWLLTTAQLRPWSQQQEEGMLSTQLPSGSAPECSWLPAPCTTQSSSKRARRDLMSGGAWDIQHSHDNAIPHSVFILSVTHMWSLHN